ncbi:venom serine carboxypeptidase-like [Planococcus citri]|uniref:venom serine carboxypeptidase-like n=1 Tax=Planococcus citri TaxID=170843 RepID=UPI0031F80273
MMLWLVILLGIQSCSSIVIRINPIVIVKYVRNDTSGDFSRFTTGPDPNAPPGVTKYSVKYLDINSSTGKFLVNKRYGSNLFWWFFPSERNSSSDPVIVWLQGQPNTSCLHGLFDEHGPYAIDPLSKAIVKREHRWTKEFNVLYLDLCTSCGYSYSGHPKGYSLSLEAVAKNLVRALHMFFSTYRNLVKNDLYLSGESMSGQYMFVVAHGIHNSNPMTPVQLNFKGLLIGNGFMDSRQLAEYRENLFRIGILPLKVYDDMYTKLPSIESSILTGDYNRAISLWNKHYYSAIREAGYNSMYDVRDTNAFWNSLVPQVATSKQIRQLLQVGNRTFNVPHNCAYFIGEVFKPTISILAEVLNQYKVLFYTGQFDMLVPYIHTANFLDYLGWKGVTGFYSSRHNAWMMNGTLVGYWKTYRSLTHVLIRNAGHMVGASQPEYLFEMVKRFVNDDGSDPKRFKRADKDV